MPNSAGQAASASARCEPRPIMPTRRRSWRRVEARAAQQRRRHAPPAVVDAADPRRGRRARCGSAPGRGLTHRRSAGPWRAVSACSRRASRSPGAGRPGLAPRSARRRRPAPRRRARSRRCIRSPAAEVAPGASSARRAMPGLDAERALAHVGEAALRGDPQRAVGAGQDSALAVAGSRRRRAAESRSTPKTPMPARRSGSCSACLGIDRREAIDARRKAVAEDDRRRASHQDGWFE